MATPEEQDDLNKWLAAQDSPNLAPQPTAATTAEPSIWSKAQALMDKQSAMQYSPKDYSQYLQKEKAPDRTGGDLRTILAMALDLFGNKGRGAGQLMQAGNENADRNRLAWEKENGPQAMLQRQMGVKQLENADRSQFNNDRAMLGAQVGQELQMAGAQQSQQNADRTFEHQAERDIAGDTQHQMDHADTLDYQNRSLTQSADLSKAQIAASNANAAASRAQAAQFHKDALTQHLDDQNQQLDERRDLFAQQEKLKNVELQGQRDKYQLEHPAAVLPQGYTAANPALFAQVAAKPELMREYTDKMSTFGKVNGALDTLTRLQTEPSSAANKRAYDSAMKMLIGDKSKEGSTGALTGTEYERYLQDLPEYGEMVGPGWRGKVDAFTGKGNSAVNTLKQMQQQYRQGHVRDLEPFGITPSDFSSQQDNSLIKRYPGLSLVQ